MNDDDLTSEAIDLVARRLANVKPARAHDLQAEARKRIAQGMSRPDVDHWHLVALVMELHACDGSAFGAVIDDETAHIPHPGGRPSLMGEEERRRFLQFMEGRSGTAQARISEFLQENAWCRLSPVKLDAQWRNRGRSEKSRLSNCMR